MRHENTEPRNADSNYAPTHETGRNTDDYNRSNRARPTQPNSGGAIRKPAERRYSAVITQSIPAKGIKGFLRSFALLFKKKFQVQS